MNLLDPSFPYSFSHKLFSGSSKDRPAVCGRDLVASIP